MRAAGASPMQWSRATTVLTPKPKGGCRPLTLGRAGAKVLQPWISQWQSGLDAGGLPGTSVEAALAQVQAAFRNKSEGLGDRLLFLRARAPVQALDAVLCHAGLQSSMGLSTSRLRLRSAWSAHAMRLRSGLLLLTSTPSASVIILRFWVFLTPSEELGLCSSLCFAVRCSVGALVLSSVRDHKHIVQSLVVLRPRPMLHRLMMQTELLRLFDDRFGIDRVQVLVWEQLGWKLQPQMPMCRGAFRTLARLFVRASQLVGDSSSDGMSSCPEIPRWLQTLKWTYGLRLALWCGATAPGDVVASGSCMTVFARLIVG